MPDEEKKRKPMTTFDRLELLNMVNFDGLTRIMGMISMYSPAMRNMVDEIRENMMKLVKQIHADFEEDNSYEPKEIADKDLPSHDKMLKALKDDPDWAETVKRLKPESELEEDKDKE